MGTYDNNELKNKFLENKIELSDTLSQFVEKCNNNFSAIIEMGGGPAGEKGDEGKPGIPAKPKTPIHCWRSGIEYNFEITTPNGEFKIDKWNEDLKDNKYQSGHLILLENAHVYILEIDDKDNFELKPKYIMALQSYNSGDIINGSNAYVHIAYANDYSGYDDFITADDLRNENTEPISTFNLRSGNIVNNSNLDRSHMGIYSDSNIYQSNNPERYTWVRIQGGIGPQGEKGEKGDQGDQGEKGEKGDKGDGYSGHPYTIDLEGDMSTISIDVDRTPLYNNDYCECKIHAYYGNENVNLNISDITINLPNEYTYLDNDIVLKLDTNSKVGKIEKIQNGNDVIIKFIPDENFEFPKKTITFSIHIETQVHDKNDNIDYNFVRDNIWMIKGIMSSFELKIIPQYRTIKLFEDNKYYPEILEVSVYKIEDSVRTLFDFNQNPTFTLLYKNYDSNEWLLYPSEGINTKNTSCIEFKVVRYYNSTDPETPEEIWDYEDVWVVADGKSVHYYHADLGGVESIMVLTTGERINIGTDSEPKYCAELRNESGYSITFEPKFYDGTEELEVESVNIGSNSGEEYYINGTFDRILETETIDNIKKYKLTITKIPYNIDMIPMTIDVIGKYNIYDENGEIKDEIRKTDTISFYVYISTMTNTYTLVPTVSAYNTSSGKNGDTIGCNVYKNNTHIPISELEQNALTLKYVVYDGVTESKLYVNYTEPLIFGDDNDIIEDEFTAKDVAIEFILYYRDKEIVKSTVPLIKDGIDGKDGDSWQYIFCRSPKYPFDNTGISDPSNWIDNNPNDSSAELLGNNGIVDEDWYDEHKGVDSKDKYEYQSYRKWDKNNKIWGKYGKPTLYSNYSESGSGYSVMLSNPFVIIPVGDDDWSVNENATNQNDSTFVYLYSNTSNISSNDNVTISLPENNIYVENGNFTITKENGVNKVNFNPVVENSIFDFQSNVQYKLPITLIYDFNEDNDGDNVIDNFSTTVNWTLTPIKGLCDVEVFVDKRVVNTSYGNIHTLKVGYYLISSDGTKTFIENNEKNSKKYKIILTDDIEDLTPNPISDWQNAQYNFVENNENRNCCVVLLEEDGSTIIDYVIVTAVNNGKDGQNGIDGLPGTGIKNTSCDYAINDSEHTRPSDEEWTGDVPELKQGKYLWTRTKWTYSDNSIEYGYSVTYISKDGYDGKDGLPGAPGMRILKTEWHYAINDSGTIHPDENSSDWSNQVPTLEQGKYLWTKTTWYYGSINDNITDSDIDDSDIEQECGYTVSYIATDGKSAMHLELSQDYISLPSSADGNSVHTDYVEKINTTMFLYNGDTLITDYNNIKYTFKVNEVFTEEIININDEGVFEIPKSIINGDTNIECIATYNETSYSKILFIDLEDTSYELELDKQTLTRDSNNNKIINDDLRVRVKYWMGGKWIYTPEGEVIATTTNGVENIKFGTPVGEDYMRILTIKDSILETNNIDTEVKISYYKDNKELSYETIGIISTGKDGADGQQGIDGKPADVNIQKYIFGSNYYPFICAIQSQCTDSLLSSLLDFNNLPIAKWNVLKSYSMSPNEIYEYIRYLDRYELIQMISKPDSNPTMYIKTGNIGTLDYTNICNSVSLATGGISFESMFQNNDFSIHIWCLEGTQTHEYDKLNNEWKLSDTIQWNLPLYKTKLQQSCKGETGEIGNVVYPAGEYEETKVYSATNKKSPYVVDSSDGEYYMLKENNIYVGKKESYDLTNGITNEPLYNMFCIDPDDATADNSIQIAATSCSLGQTIIIGPDNAIANPNNTSLMTTYVNKLKDNGKKYGYAILNIIGYNKVLKKYYTLNSSGTKIIVASKYMYSVDGVSEEWLPDMNQSPAENALSENPVWEKFESFEAIYAKIAMIDNGTIGSAVYRGDYMFSQQGIDSDGNISTSYQNFNPEHIYDSESEFKPNICMNFKTGQMWAACGNIQFDDKNIILKADNTTIDGNLKTSGLIFKNKTTLNINDLLLDEYYRNVTIATKMTLNGQLLSPKSVKFINFEKLGNYIELTGILSNDNVDKLHLQFPSSFVYDHDNELFGIVVPTSQDYYRSLIGQTILIYNNSYSEIPISCGGVIDELTNTATSMCMLPLQPDEYIRLYFDAINAVYFSTDPNIYSVGKILLTQNNLVPEKLSNTNIADIEFEFAGVKFFRGRYLRLQSGTHILQ